MSAVAQWAHLSSNLPSPKVEVRQQSYLSIWRISLKTHAARCATHGRRTHFMTKRFDRRGNDKVHVQTFGGLMHLDFNTPYVHGYEQYLRAVLDLNLGAPALEQAWLRCAFNIAAVNCDDRTKNFAFMLDESGEWRIAPAYDTCFSHNPAAGNWTRQHQMLVTGKAWGVTDTDLSALADAFDIRRPKDLLKRVAAAVARWPEFANQAGAPRAETDRIQAFHPDWVKALA
jgi:serine/threonine-protein kinase HipA